VLLFVRAANKITPTAAAEELYQLAVQLLGEAAAIKQKMQKYSPETRMAEQQTVMIGLDNILTRIYGEEIFATLKKEFPEMRFLYSSCDRYEGDDFYKKFDLAIYFAHDEKMMMPLKNALQDYDVKTLLKDDVTHIWVGNNSPYVTQPMLSFAELKEKEVRFINLRNMMPKGEVVKTTVEIPDFFVELLESAGCVAVDMAINHGKFVYQDLLEGRSVTLKQMDTSFALEAIYKKDITENFLSVIMSIILQK